MRNKASRLRKTFSMWQYITRNGWERLVKNYFTLSPYTCNNESNENNFKNICYLKKNIC